MPHDHDSIDLILTDPRKAARLAADLTDADSGFDALHDLGGLDAARLGRVIDRNDDRAYYGKDWR